MSFNLISDLIDRNSILYFAYQSRLDKFIDQQKDELRGISCWHDDNPLVTETLKYFSQDRLSPLSDLISNEVFFDLVAGIKSNDNRFKGRNDIQKIINLTYAKYAQFIRIKAAVFFKDLSKLRTKLKKEKWKIKKIKRVPQPFEPVKITLDIRFAIIKRANGNCEGCNSSIFESPVDVFQITSEGKIKFIAYCDVCREANKDEIIDEPEEELENA